MRARSARRYGRACLPRECRFASACRPSPLPSRRLNPRALERRGSSSRRQRATILGEVAADALAGRVTGYGLEQRHQKHLQEEQARLRPLAQSLKLTLHRCELLQDVGCVHCLAPEVVGGAVQGVGCLVLLVALLVEFAVETVGAGEVEHHMALCRDVLRRQLQEQPYERGRGEAHCARERLRAF